MAAHICLRLSGRGFVVKADGDGMWDGEGDEGGSGFGSGGGGTHAWDGEADGYAVRVIVDGGKRHELWRNRCVAMPGLVVSILLRQVCRFQGCVVEQRLRRCIRLVSWQEQVGMFHCGAECRGAQSVGVEEEWCDGMRCPTEHVIAGKR